MKRACLIAVFCLLSATLAWAGGFSGSIKFREQGGKDTYEVIVNQGRVISGWCGSEGNPRYRIVGGWYDGSRLVFLYQNVGNDINNRWFSGARHLRREGRNFILEYDLSGFKQVLTSHPVPYVIVEQKGS